MRITVEITAKQRARSLEIAAMRGLKGFSTLVQEEDMRAADSHTPRALLYASGSTVPPWVTRGRLRTLRTTTTTPAPEE